MADKETTKKPGFFSRLKKGITRWVREMRSELKKVVWPTRTQLLNNSWVVIVAVICVGLVIAGLDFVMQTVINALVGIAG